MDQFFSSLKSLIFFSNCFVCRAPMKQFGGRRNHFSLVVQNSGNRRRLSTRQQKRRTAPAARSGDRQMRTASFILAFAFVLAASSMAGSVEGSLPGIGTFAYGGAPGTALVIAAR
jgi:uncharacterized transporter YbjL